MSANKKWACRNGEFIDEEDATIHALAPAVKYASAVFEGCRAYRSKADGELYAFRLDEHIKRLLDGMRILRFETDIDLDTLRNWCRELVLRNEHEADAYFRILAYIDGKGDQGSRGPVSFMVTSADMGRGREFEKGFRLGVSSWVRVSDRAMPPRVKCIANYHNGRLGILDAQEQGFDYPLFLTELGKVSETAGSCIFLLRDGAVFTPDINSDILESITRDTAIQLLREDGIQVTERSVDRSELYLADEGFITGTFQEICPVVSIDGLGLGSGEPGDFVRRLQHRFVEIVEGSSDDHAEWRLCLNQ